MKHEAEKDYEVTDRTDPFSMSIDTTAMSRHTERSNDLCGGLHLISPSASAATSPTKPPCRRRCCLSLKPRLEGRVLVMQEKLSFGIGLPAYEFQDSHGNITYRSMFMPGRNEIRHDALVAVSSLPDSREVSGPILPVGQLPSELLRYTLPSRYCDSDKLMNFAWNQFGQVTHGLPRVQAICDWVHNNIEYRFMSGRSDLSASEVIERRYGVCRDFAHAAIALCRAFNLPARYVTGHLPDIGYVDPGTPMDFHAYCEVYLGQEWLTFDPRYNVPRIGRVKVAHGADAVDGAFATIYGEANADPF